MRLFIFGIITLSTRGLAFAAASILTWGSFPVYFNLLAHVQTMSVIGHRMIWAAVFMIAAFTVVGNREELAAAMRDAGISGNIFVSGCLLGISWVVYVWAVQRGYIVESSLGYFLTPILTVAIGRMIFRERLNPRQWGAVLLAFAGVVAMAALNGIVPWLSLFLGGIFAIYSAIRKRIKVAPYTGSLIETLFMLPFGVLLVFLFPAYPEAGGQTLSVYDMLLLIGSGVITILPLVWYISASQLMPLSILGTLFYGAPALGFLSGVFVFHEPFTTGHAAMFSMILLALTIFSIDAIRSEQLRNEAQTNSHSRYRRL